MSCISYPSLQCVLQYIEANRRFQLSQRIPAIESAERATPLKIDYLYIGKLHLKINETSYRLGIIRHCETEELMEPFKKMNSYGGEQNDLDRFGLPDRKFEKTVLPGDIVIENEIEDQDVNLDLLVEDLRNLMILEGLERQEVPDEPEVVVPNAYDDVIAPQADILEELYQLQTRRQKRHYERINEHQHLILPLRLREDNAVSPYSTFIQLLVKSETEKKERVEYKKSIHEAMKSLMVKILGGRRGNIYVKHFHAPPCGGVFRIPVGLHFKIKHLEIGKNVEKVLNSLKPILDFSSFPLDSIELNALRQLPEDFQHPIVRTSEKLAIKCSSGITTWLNIFLGLGNKIVSWRRGAFELNETVTFVKNWIENRKSVGSYFTFAITRPGFAQEILPLLKDLPNAKLAILEGISCETFPHCVSIPIGENAELNIYGEECETVYREALWDFKMKVMPRGSAEELRK